MCYVTATELKKNLSYYMALSLKEDVFVTKNKKVICLLTNPEERAFQEFMALRGILKKGDTGEDYEEMIGGEIAKRCGF